MTMHEYIFSIADYSVRLAKIDAIIDGLYTLTLSKINDEAGVYRYKYNDGQTDIWTTFESMSSITDNIKFWENQKVRLRRQTFGSTTYAIPGNL